MPARTPKEEKIEQTLDELPLLNVPRVRIEPEEEAEKK